MHHPIPIVARVLAGSAVIACFSILSGCWWGRREPRHDDRRVDVHEDHHDEHHDDHRDDHHDDH
jgi:hypothetical protein